MTKSELIEKLAMRFPQLVAMEVITLAVMVALFQAVNFLLWLALILLRLLIVKDVLAQFL